MELTWKRLLYLMQALSDHSVRLVEIAQRQRESIVLEQIHKIGEIVIEQEEEMKNFQALDQEREALLETLWEELHLTHEAKTLSNILPRVPAAWSNEYKQAAERLRSRMEEVKRENEINRQLLSQSQKFTGWLLNYLVTPTGATPTYDRTGSNHNQSFYHIVNQTL